MDFRDRVLEKRVFSINCIQSVPGASRERPRNVSEGSRGPGASRERPRRLPEHPGSVLEGSRSVPGATKMHVKIDARKRSRKGLPAKHFPGPFWHHFPSNKKNANIDTSKKHEI